VISKQEMFDRYLHLYELAIERGWICIQVNKIAQVLSGVPLAVFWFYAETADVYDKITAWLKQRGTTSGIVRLRTIMMRGWDAPVQSIYAKAQFSRSGNKQTCHVCGYEIGQEELVVRGVCPRCQTKLW
jgi:predicted Zn-ribbon and HTH transcriptional regulator